ERLDRAADDGPGLGAVVDHLELDGLILGDGVGPDVVLDEGVALAGNVLGDRARGWLAALGHLDDPGLKLGPGGEPLDPDAHRARVPRGTAEERRAALVGVVVVPVGILLLPVDRHPGGRWQRLGVVLLPGRDVPRHVVVLALRRRALLRPAAGVGGHPEQPAAGARGGDEIAVPPDPRRHALAPQPGPELLERPELGGGGLLALPAHEGARGPGGVAARLGGLLVAEAAPLEDIPVRANPK